MRRPDFIARQAARPHGLLGRVIGHIMGAETAAANRAALPHLAPPRDARVLEVGCGHGRTIERLAALVPHGQVTGLDHSDAMLALARRRCAALVRAGRVRIDCGDSAHLPYADAAFDRVLAVHTIYFWAPLEPHLAELRRVLARRGRLVLAFRRPTARARRDCPAAIYALRSAESVAAALSAAGFGAVAVEGDDDLAIVAADVDAAPGRRL